MTGIERLRKMAEVYRNNGNLFSAAQLDSIADQIEREQRRDQASDVSVSAYDLLPPDEREAIAWVREHGGLGAVKRDAACWNTAENIAQTTLGWLARVCPVAGIEKCGYGVALEKLEDAINRRLMPDGMEWLLEVWPKWSNGEYCKFGDWWKSDTYGEPEPKQFRKLSIYTPEQLDEWGQGDGESYGYEWDFVRPADPKYRPDKAEPPAPKVLDADGVEIRVGDTVYSTRGTESGTVVYAYPPGDDGQPSVKVGAFWHHASELTHRAPVLAADGKPIREGETVWLVSSGLKLEVDTIFDPGCVACVKPGTGQEGGSPSADELTHDRPDSWERLEEDAANLDEMPCDYSAKDLVRRAKALAERDAK